jgi:hypothetical protein
VKQPLTVDDLRALLSYEPETGEFWIRRPVHVMHRTRPAGYVRRDGYRVIGVSGGQYLAHRLAWLYMTGEWPAAFIDHRNLAKDDNRWANLRAATKSQNGANTRLLPQNTSGFKGVIWCKQMRRWVAQIKVNGRAKYLGCFQSREDAAAAYALAAAALFGEFARAA